MAASFLEFVKTAFTNTASFYFFKVTRYEGDDIVSAC